MGQAGVEPEAKNIEEMVKVAKPVVMRVMEIYGYKQYGDQIKKEGVGLDSFLLHMPREWRTDTGNPFENRYGVEMAIATFNAINELVVEGKLKFCLYLERTGHMMEIEAEGGTSRDTPMGNWRLGVMLA